MFFVRVPDYRGTLRTFGSQARRAPAGQAALAEGYARERQGITDWRSARPSAAAAYAARCSQDSALARPSVRTFIWNGH